MALPVELISHIFQYLPPEQNLFTLQLVSQQFRRIAGDPLLWRYYCLSSFRYWAPEHDLELKVSQDEATTVGWKDLWLRRKSANYHVARQLDAIIETSRRRLERIEDVCSYGLDAKDFLLDQCRAPDEVQDVLARRYWANIILDSIHRGIAVDVWSRHQFEDPFTQRQLDVCLGAFDMFALHDQDQDTEWVRERFNAVAADFQKEHPLCKEWSTRHLALTLVRWLRAKGFRGVPGPEADNYRNLRNCLLGHALSEADHASLPIISCAIYQQIASRLGLQANLISYPSHVHVSVQPGAELDLDGQPVADGSKQGAMYLNPYGSDGEVSEPLLRHQLAEHGWTGNADVFLQPASVSEIVLRAAQNIKATYNLARSLSESDPLQAELTSLRAGHSDLNRDAVYYGSLWARLMITPVNQAGWDANLDYFLQRFALMFSEDMWIVNKYLRPLYDEFIDGSAPHRRHRVDWENLHGVLSMLRNLDNRETETNRRYTEDIQQRVLYKVGQVFRHKRYGYIGVINGWTTGGSGPLPTPTYLQGGEDDQGTAAGSDGADGAAKRSRTFYSALRSGLDRIKVAQENIEVITDASLIPENLKFIAGKFFKRFDTETCRFVSNIQELYPDD